MLAILFCVDGDETCQVFREVVIFPVGVIGFVSLFVSVSNPEAVVCVVQCVTFSVVLNDTVSLACIETKLDDSAVFSSGTTPSSTFSSPRKTFSLFPFPFPGDGETFGDTPPAIVTEDAGYTGWYT